MARSGSWRGRAGGAGPDRGHLKLPALNDGSAWSAEAVWRGVGPCGHELLPCHSHGGPQGEWFDQIASPGAALRPRARDDHGKRHGERGRGELKVPESNPETQRRRVWPVSGHGEGGPAGPGPTVAIRSCRCCQEGENGCRKTGQRSLEIDDIRHCEGHAATAKIRSTGREGRR